MLLEMPDGERHPNNLKMMDLRKRIPQTRNADIPRRPAEKLQPDHPLNPITLCNPIRTICIPEWDPSPQNDVFSPEIYLD
jgi:hypothetical protein